MDIENKNCQETEQINFNVFWENLQKTLKTNFLREYILNYSISAGTFRLRRISETFSISEKEFISNYFNNEFDFTIKQN